MEDTPPSCAIRCSGELDFASYADLQAVIEECIRTHPSRLDLDLSKLSFMDSAGVRTIALAARSCREQQIAFGLELSSIGRRVLSSLGLEDLVDSVIEHDDALGLEPGTPA